MKRRRYPKVNATGRSKGDCTQHVRLDYGMLKHPNFRALNGAAVKVLLGLCTKHTGFNNGKVFYSAEDAARDLGIGKATVFRAFLDLQYYGFIKLIKRGHFYGRKAHEWELTFVRSDGYSKTDDWKDAKSKLRKRKPKSKGFVEELIEIADQEN